MIPIIENTAEEHELSDSLVRAMDAYPEVIIPSYHFSLDLVRWFIMPYVYNLLRISHPVPPKAQAVLVQRHGIYVWGDTWEKVGTSYFIPFTHVNTYMRHSM